MSAECYWPGDHIQIVKCKWTPKVPMKLKTRALNRFRMKRKGG